ncbi:MAG: HD domain-containing protein [Lachnospiraceae bacterium]|jgi:uncharacterized protein|uniref:HD domain-containing protein n=1 Tax=Candidatus Merdisoma sp. JLR.KK006 TaxID=3112626 RepID=UPI002FF0B989|nr:HD domain-containing protein [Lachnospiraceae bacterium]
MKRIDAIWRHETYQSCLKKLNAWEEKREFCRHTPEHFLDVARITWILALEAGIPAKKEIIYAAGLLHDIGRFRQYEEGIPHEQASVRIAEGILRDCGFEESEREQVLELIQSHRTKQQEKSLSGLFYKGDKLSRNCFSCPVRDKCDWPEEKKNLSIGI